MNDENGPLSGASVSIEGNKGTTTDNSDAYELSVKPGTYTLMITYIGYQLNTQQVNVRSNETTEANAKAVNSSIVENIVVLGSRSVTGS